MLGEYASYEEPPSPMCSPALRGPAKMVQQGTAPGIPEAWFVESSRTAGACQMVRAAFGGPERQMPGGATYAVADSSCAGTRHVSLSVIAALSSSPQLR